ncbi:hypothetical protein B0H13DRAFT_2274150 [Mycena leptocephala]|nr:hypothetical protein B0H13DRAFT_2274150 [Mycena leptocephala]
MSRALREWQTRHCCGVRGHKMLCSSCCESESDTCSKRSRNAGEETTTTQGRRNALRNASGLNMAGMLWVGVERERFGDDNEECGDGRFSYLRVLRCADGGAELKRGDECEMRSDGRGRRRARQLRVHTSEGVGLGGEEPDEEDAENERRRQQQKGERGGPVRSAVVRIADAGGQWDEYETRQSLDRKDYVEEEGDDGNNAPETHDSQR